MLTQFGDSIYLDERVEYVFIRDFGIAYGSIYESFSRYIKNDLKQYMNFFDRERPTFISTAISTVKQFPLPVEFLLSKAKPSISFQYAIDYANRFAPTDIHPADNFEAAMYLRSTDFTEFILGFETTATDNDLGDIRRRDLAISTAYRNIHLTCGVRVNLDSEYDRDNLSQYWQIKRRDGSKYQVQMLVDYEIPYILVMHIADRYGFLDENSNVKRHEFLNFLNKNSVHTVYYTTNGATNKDAYVISKIQEAFVEVGPIGNESFEVDDAVSYTVVNRTFELDVRIPMFFAVTRYGERFLFNEGNTLSEMGVDDLANHSAEVNRGFLLREFQRVFEEKHAIKEQILQYQEEDIIKLPNSKETRKIDLVEFIEDEPTLYEFTKWCLEEKGLQYEDIYSFKLYKSSREEFNKIEPDKDQSIYAEYQDYIINTQEMYLVDKKPKIGEEVSLLIYVNLVYYNEYNRKILNKGVDTFSRYDDAVESIHPIRPDNDGDDFKSDW